MFKEFKDVAEYKANGIPEGYPDNIVTLWAGLDRVHELIVDILKSARRSIVLNMFGYDDDEADQVIRDKMQNERVYVQMSLDKTQSKGVHERVILAKWPTDAVGSSIAVGTSKRHAISHLKLLVVDGIYTVSGSTNWSLSGEQKQDNELTVSNNAVRAAEFRSVMDVNHDWMLKQMAGSSKG